MKNPQMPQKVTVEVTEEHIENGKENNAYWCPIALALCGQGWHTVAVSTSTVQVTKLISDKAYAEGKRVECTYPLPQSALDFIYRFDAGREQCFPFSFEMERHPEF